ncbi:XRE family transcriptional regulator [Streptomyces sp. NBC_00820]|uniref:helix-turn-helix domain-containing protein n=1 Tax=Streptomyces sp. NBC_00820 TaxID=2975842 RepID=UPI002ED33AF3|nr:XRE family transcriptional regulator [Streptomyces sp. NBC_00820]
MPRWKALPDELDPQIKEFTSQLRHLVDRSGLGVAALADRTGYSRTSWDSYLAGRLLAPKGAIIALAEVTGSHPGHLTTMWELAERAWSRAEMRHDRTMEQLRISQARAALGVVGAAQAEAAGATRTTPEDAAPKDAAPKGTTSKGTKPDGTTPALGIAGPAGVSPTLPRRPTAAGSGEHEKADTGGADSKRNSWGLAGYQGPSPASRRPVPGARTGTGAGAGSDSGSGVGLGVGPGVGLGLGGGAAVRPPVPPHEVDSTSVLPSPFGAPPRVSGPAGGVPAGGSGGGQRLMMFLAGFGAVLLIIGVVFLFTHRGGAGGHEAATKSSSPAVSAQPTLPPGVKCAGAACAGKDAEAMGCSGELVATAKTATVGATTLEVRYSKTCGTAWGRITGGSQGDRVRVTVGKIRQAGDIATAGDTIAYTPMVAVKDAAEVKACAILAAGQTGCTA